MIKQLYKQFVSERTRNNVRIRLRKAVSPFYSGDKYFCNCCDRSFRKFLSKGNVKRSNAQCPNCGSLERTRILNFYLENETSLFKNDLKVLHVAPEDCLFKILKKLDIEYVDGDINEANATHLIDLTEIPYSDNYFDLIICSHVLGHIPDEARAIREMKRVLKEDGTALVMTLIDLNSEITFEDKSVNSDQQRLLKYGESDLCRLHGLDFDQRLKSEGFKVEKINYTEKLPKEYAERYQLGDGSRELIFRCTKI